jgi:hypothetical protein
MGWLYEPQLLQRDEKEISSYSLQVFDNTFVASQYKRDPFAHGLIMVFHAGTLQAAWGCLRDGWVPFCPWQRPSAPAV